MKTKKVIANSFIFVFTRVMLKAASFFLVPIYTAFLSTSEYGMINIAGSFTSTAAILVTINLSFAVGRFYADYPSNSTEVKRLFGTILFFSFFVSTLFCIFAIIAKDILLSTIFKGFKFYPSLICIIISLPFYCLYSLYQDVLCAMQDAKRSGMEAWRYYNH